MSKQTQLFAQDGKLTVKAPPPDPETPTKRMRTAGAVEEMAKAWSDRLRLFKKQRQVYTDEQKLTMCDLLIACHGNVSQACEVAHECGITIDWHTMKRSTQDTGQRGRPVNAEFERAVLGKCIFQILSGDSLQPDGRILANILHSLNIVVMAGHSTIAEKPFCDDASLRKLQFSRCWARGLIERHHLRKRSVSTTIDKKQMPAPEEIRKMQRATQMRLDSGRRQPGDVISADESGINYCVAEKVIYAPTAADRLPAAGDDKVRITGHMAGTGASEMLPAHLIIKCACKDDGRQENTRVLDDLLPHLPANQGWQISFWTGTYRLSTCHTATQQPSLYDPSRLSLRDGYKISACSFTFRLRNQSRFPVSHLGVVALRERPPRVMMSFRNTSKSSQDVVA
jgi:hypothetical protein